MFSSFSPNMLKTYKDCPKRYYFRYVENIAMPQFISPFEKGKKIHALANYYLQGVNIDRLEKSLNVEEKGIWELLKSNEFYNKESFKSEFSLTSKVAQYWVGGRIDALVRDGDKYYILDYKTGTTPSNPEFDYQTMVYLLSVDKYLKRYSSLSFVYINLRDKNNYIIPFDTVIKRKYEEEIFNACERISSDNLYKCAKSNCKNCEYSKICEI